MKAQIYFLLICLLGIHCYVVGEEATLPDFSEQQFLQKLVDGNNQFAFDLFHQIQNQPGNFCFSPYNVLSGLGILAAGAKGETAHEFQQVFHFSLSLLPLIGDLNIRLSKKGGNAPQIASGSALWAQKDLSLSPSFKLRIERELELTLQKVDYTHDLSTTIQTIDQWGRTKGKIINSVNAQDINPHTRLLLTSVISLSGGWAQPFAQKNTKKLPFRVSPQRILLTQMMQITASYPFSQGEKWNVIAIPFLKDEQGVQLEMIIFLPKEFSLNELERNFSWENWKGWLALLREQKVTLMLPRFRLDKRFDLNNPLRKLGLKSLFDSEANLTGISDIKGLFLNKAIHKTNLKIDENGSDFKNLSKINGGMKEEAAPLRLMVDHPFLFLIWDRQSGIILWMGRVALP